MVSTRRTSKASKSLRKCRQSAYRKRQKTTENDTKHPNAAQ